MIPTYPSARFSQGFPRSSLMMSVSTWLKNRLDYPFIYSVAPSQIIVGGNPIVLKNDLSARGKDFSLMGFTLINPKSDTKSCANINPRCEVPGSLEAKNVSMKMSHAIISYQSILSFVMNRLLR